MPLAIITFLAQRDLSGDTVVNVADIVPLVEKTMDATSGILYAIFLNALLRSLAISPPGEATSQIWAKALEQSSAAMSKYTSARPGDRTLVNAIYPFIEVLGKTGDVKQAAEAASLGAERTKGMKASLGEQFTLEVPGSKNALTQARGACDPSSLVLLELSPTIPTKTTYVV